MANRPRKSPQAEADLTSIWRFIAEDSAKAADALLDRIEEAFDMLARMPLAGRARTTLGLKLRSFPVGNYVIFYVPVADGAARDERVAGRRRRRHGVNRRHGEVE